MSVGNVYRRLEWLANSGFVSRSPKFRLLEKVEDVAQIQRYLDDHAFSSLCMLTDLGFVPD